MDSSSAIREEAMEALRKASTGMIMDALALLGIDGGVVGIGPARGFEDAKVVGPAFTVLFAPKRPDTPKLSNYFAIENAEPGSVLVIDGKGMGVHWAGDNVGHFAKTKGLAGVVIHGAARDLAGWREVGMPVYCTGLATKDKPANFKITAINAAVEIGGALVKPGDIIVADEDGVVCVPLEALEPLVEKMELLVDVEEGMQRAIKQGATAAELEAIIAKKKPK